jgi:hypothetical protein
MRDVLIATISPVPAGARLQVACRGRRLFR